MASVLVAICAHTAWMQALGTEWVAVASAAPVLAGLALSDARRALRPRVHVLDGMERSLLTSEFYDLEESDLARDALLASWHDGQALRGDDTLVTRRKGPALG